jgi:DNA-binding transcriptional MerR regulator
MFKIGDFSRLSMVSVKALRYYDEIGLLKPAQVDEFTGYRYYSASQMPSLNRIVALKSLGLTLTEIARLTADNLPPQELQCILDEKRVDIQAQLREGQNRLQRLETWILNVSGENILAEYEVNIRSLPAIRVATLRRTIPTYWDSDKLWQEFCGPTNTWLASASGEPGFSICHETEYKDHDVDVEIAIPVRADAVLPANVNVKVLPEVKQAAILIHRGGYEGLKDANFAMMEWIEKNGYQIAGPDREIYIKGPGMEPMEPEDYVTEIQYPVEKV